MTSEPPPAQTDDNARRREVSAANHLEAWLRRARAVRVVPGAVFIFVGCMMAILEQRADAWLAWGNWLDLFFGLLLPCLGFALSLKVVQADTDPFCVDSARARLGANRRAIRARRIALSVGVGLLLGLVVLLLGRALSYPATTTYLNRDLWLCVGLGALATGTYITFFAATARLGLGRSGAAIAFSLDLTLGHAEGAWALIVPHPYLVSLINSPGNSLTSPYLSSIVLVAMAFASTAFIVAKTPR